MQERRIPPPPPPMRNMGQFNRSVEQQNTQNIQNTQNNQLQFQNLQNSQHKFEQISEIKPENQTYENNAKKKKGLSATGKMALLILGSIIGILGGLACLILLFI